MKNVSKSLRNNANRRGDKLSPCRRVAPLASPESLDIERFHFRRAILDLEQVAPLVDGGGLLRTFTIQFQFNSIVYFKHTFGP